jgi:prevent-host-death family protein
MKTSPTSVGAFDAKNRFSELLEQVGRGAEFIITKNDRPVARLGPASTPAEAERKGAAADLRELRKRYGLGGLSVRELMDEGRS